MLIICFTSSMYTTVFLGSMLCIPVSLFMTTQMCLATQMISTSRGVRGLAPVFARTGVRGSGDGSAPGSYQFADAVEEYSGRA
jgi:hypothetical protein